MLVEEMADNGHVILSASELKHITGYSSPLKQLDILHRRGFSRAYRSRGGQIILERSHYMAVCRGEFAPSLPMSVMPTVNTAFMKQQPQS